MLSLTINTHATHLNVLRIHEQLVMQANGNLPMNYVNTSLPIPEIFKRVSEQPTIEDKANMLKQFDRRDIRWVVDFMYNADVTGLYIPDYTPSSTISGVSYASFNTSLARIESALNNRNNKKIYERVLCGVLETMHESEATLLCDILLGKKIEGVSKQVFKKAYPAFFRESDESATS